jgi:hypothetical protein
VREIRTLRVTWRGLETWPWWNCEPIPQSKERDWKPSTYSRRACPRPYRGGGHAIPEKVNGPYSTRQHPDASTSAGPVGALDSAYSKRHCGT